MVHDVPDTLRRFLFRRVGPRYDIGVKDTPAITVEPGVLIGNGQLCVGATNSIIAGNPVAGAPGRVTDPVDVVIGSDFLLAIRQRLGQGLAGTLVTDLPAIGSLTIGGNDLAIMSLELKGPAQRCLDRKSVV